MKLNRNNYEEYFILYLDNELNDEMRREVEAFAAINPDLKAELDLLIQTKLTPEHEAAFPDKGSLMRFDNSSISVANYEEWLTAYIDDELNESERRDVEVFVAGNPAIQRELNLLQQAKLKPETIVFPYKESLYRKEEKAKVIGMRWWRVAAAAVLLIGVSTASIFVINNNKTTSHPNGLANSNPKTSPSTNSVSEPVSIPATTNPSVAQTPGNNEETVLPKEKENIKPAIARQTNKISEDNGVIKEVPLKEETPLIAESNTKEKQPSGNLPQSTKIIAATNGNDLAIHNNESIHAKETLTPGDENSTNSIVTAAHVETSDITEQSGGNKGLRGFLRKVTRTFEKRTKIKATDDDDRLLVAGLAIKL